MNCCTQVGTLFTEWHYRICYSICGNISTATCYPTFFTCEDNKRYFTPHVKVRFSHNCFLNVKLLIQFSCDRFFLMWTRNSTFECELFKVLHVKLHIRFSHDIFITWNSKCHICNCNSHVMWKCFSSHIWKVVLTCEL